jgi:anti-sigma regulatory factor (Ser/Thr protein kinase)
MSAGTHSMGDEVTRLYLRLPGTNESAAAARHSVGAVLTPFAPRSLSERVELLVSELVTNALRHGRAKDDASIQLKLNLTPARVRVEVVDGGIGFDPPETPAERADQMAGWGLVLVNRLASDWGVVRNGSTVVWFEIDGEAAG